MPTDGAYRAYARFMSDHLSFPRQYARTQRFSLGAPRAFTASPDGERVVFVRSSSGTDRAGALWVWDAATGTERIAADPAALLGGAAEELTPEERARRERMEWLRADLDRVRRHAGVRVYDLPPAKARGIKV